MSSRGTAEEKRQKAQVHFEKAEQRRREAAISHDEVRLRREAEAAKTSKLRELRLAKEAEDEHAANTARAEKPAAVKKNARQTEKQTDR